MTKSTKNEHAVALGKKGLGVKRHHTKKHLAVLEKRLASINKTVTTEQKAEAAKKAWVTKRRKAQNTLPS